MHYWGISKLISQMPSANAEAVKDWLTAGGKTVDMPMNFIVPGVVHAAKRTVPLVTGSIGWTTDGNGSIRMAVLAPLNTFEFHSIERCSVLFDGELTMVTVDKVH